MSDATLAPPVTIDEYYELRLYQMIPTRLPVFHELLRDHVPPLWARNGVPAPLGVWEGHAGPMAPLYAYILPWRSLDERMAAWGRFYADPDWQAALAENYAGRQRVERSNVFILRPSPAWTEVTEPAAAPRPVDGVHEMRVLDLLNQAPPKAHAALAETDLPFLKMQGAEVLGVFATWYGTRMNQAVVFLAWPDAETMRRGHDAHMRAPEIQAVREAERRANGRPLLRGTDVHVLRPLPYGVPRTNLAVAPSEADA